MAETSYLWEEPEKLRSSGGKGAGKHAATLLAQEVQLAGEAAEEARKNRESRAAAVKQSAAKPATAAASQAGDFVGEKQVLEFACDASFMQGREEVHLNRHVVVKDLVAAAKAFKMPLSLAPRTSAMRSEASPQLLALLFAELSSHIGSGMQRLFTEHCDSTGSTDGITAATLELLEPGELLKEDVTEEGFQRRLIEQDWTPFKLKDEEIAMLRQALQRLQDGRAELRSLAVALETKALPLTLTAVLGPAAAAAKPKAVTSTTVVKKAGLAPLVPIAPLPPPLPGAEKALDFAPLLPATPLAPPKRAGPPVPPPEPPKEVKDKPEAANEQRGSPEDWIEFRDARTAKAYFYNPVTKDSSWTRPPPKPPPPPPPVKPKMDPVKAAAAAAGLIPGTKDPEELQPKVIDPKAESKAPVVAKAPPPKRVDLVNDEPELSALIIFSDASSLGVAEVARELLRMSGCVLLHDGPCELSSSKWRLLLGLSPVGKTKDFKDLEVGQWQSWFDHLQHQSHWLFVVRRSGAVALLQQMCFGPSLRLTHRRRVSFGPLRTSTTSFLQLQESMRPWPSPMFLSLQALLFSPGDGKEAAPHVSPSAPVAGMACHSAVHAAAFVAEVAPELLQSQEVVLAVPASVNQADFDALKKILTTKPMSYVELLSVATNEPVLMSKVEASRPGESRRAFSLSSLNEGLGWTKNQDAWKLPEGQSEGLARVAVFSRMAAAKEVEVQTIHALYGWICQMLYAAPFHYPQP
eukprot:s1304_g6.t1